MWNIVHLFGAPRLAKDIDTLEKVQKQAKKMIRGLGQLPYE